MRRFVLRAFVVVVAAVFFQSCILSRLVDRAFVGISAKRPLYTERYTTGLVLLPITFVIDVATFPLQLLLVAILGDDFVLGPDIEGLERRPVPNYAGVLRGNPQFQKLSEAAQQEAIFEFETLVSTGSIDRD